jgi:hypothetical protein
MYGCHHVQACLRPCQLCSCIAAPSITFHTSIWHTRFSALTQPVIAAQAASQGKGTSRSQGAPVARAPAHGIHSLQPALRQGCGIYPARRQLLHKQQQHQPPPPQSEHSAGHSAWLWLIHSCEASVGKQRKPPNGRTELLQQHTNLNKRRCPPWQSTPPPQRLLTTPVLTMSSNITGHTGRRPKQTLASQKYTAKRERCLRPYLACPRMMSSNMQQSCTPHAAAAPDPTRRTCLPCRSANGPPTTTNTAGRDSAMKHRGPAAPTVSLVQDPRACLTCKRTSITSLPALNPCSPHLQRAPPTSTVPSPCLLNTTCCLHPTLLLPNTHQPLNTP